MRKRIERHQMADEVGEELTDLKQAVKLVTIITIMVVACSLFVTSISGACAVVTAVVAMTMAWRYRYDLYEMFLAIKIAWNELRHGG